MWNNWKVRTYLDMLDILPTLDKALKVEFNSIKYGKKNIVIVLIIEAYANTTIARVARLHGKYDWIQFMESKRNNSSNSYDACIWICVSLAMSMISEFILRNALILLPYVSFAPKCWIMLLFLHLVVSLFFNLCAFSDQVQTVYDLDFIKFMCTNFKTSIGFFFIVATSVLNFSLLQNLRTDRNRDCSTIY